MKKFRIQNLVQVFLPGKVVFGDLKSLLQKALLELDEESVIPGKDGDLAIRMSYFTNKAHIRSFSCPKVILSLCEKKRY